MIRTGLAGVVAGALVAWAAVAEENAEVTRLKAEIVTVAQSYEGQGDQDFSRQNRLQALVDDLLTIAPQPPVSERLSDLYGPWRQVWGPYDYRSDGSRGVDPQLTVDEIYQVVSPDGHYYNVTPLQPDDPRDPARIGLLRGVYERVDDQSDFIRVRFTAYPGVPERPTAPPLWELPALAEADALDDEISIVPRLIVWLFFGDGYLREVYTDADLRITYGGSDLKDRSDEFIYIMTRPDGWDGTVQ